MYAESYPQLVYTSIELTLAKLFALAIYRLYFHPLSGYPGPRLAAISRWYSAFYAWRGILHLQNKTWHDKYGEFKFQARPRPTNER